MYFPQTGFPPSQPVKGRDEAMDAACVCVGAAFSVWLAVYVCIVCTHAHVPVGNTPLWTWPHDATAVSSMQGYPNVATPNIDLSKLVLLYHLAA